MLISVIIPTLNEESCLKETLEAVGRDVEVIVVDGESCDSTVKIAKGFTDKIIMSEKGRGLQMDRGAEEAGGDIFLFLHADTILPKGWKDYVEGALKDDDKVIGGGFRLKIDSKGFSFRMIEAVANMRAKYLGLIYGDQAIFVKKDAFLSAGGFKGLPLMEDVDLIRRLREAGRVMPLEAEVSTSPRQWKKRGVLKTTLRNLFFLSLYYAGVSPERLQRLYYA